MAEKSEGKSVKYEVEFVEAASRKELLVRMVWAIPCTIVAGILAFVGGIAAFLQFFHIIFTRKRHAMLHKYLLMAVDYKVKFASYMYLNDERCPIMPDGI